MRSLGFKPGAFLDEGRIGTNAFAVSLAESFPIQIVGAEHFLSEFHGLHSVADRCTTRREIPSAPSGCSATDAVHAPFPRHRVRRGQGDRESAPGRAPAFREADAQATEFNATLDAISEGILAWTAQGIVTHLNGRGGELLGIKPSPDRWPPPDGSHHAARNHFQGCRTG